jgi:WD40 repeat protein
MKSAFGMLMLALFVLVSCSPVPTPLPTPTPSPTLTSSATPSPTVTVTPSPTLTPTASPTLTLTATFTPSPTATLALPVGLKTPIPDSGAQITSQNVQQLQEIARYYGNFFLARLTKDRSRLFVRDTLSVSIYDYALSQRIQSIAIPGQSLNLGLQISDDGTWALLDSKWLFHPGTDQSAKDFKDIVTLAGFDKASRGVKAALSPDGKNIAIYQLDCSGGGCVSNFLILDPLTTRPVYTWKGTYTDLHGADPTFSPDSSLLAAVVDANVVVWNLADRSMLGKFPFNKEASDYVISGDLSLIAIRANNSITISSLKTGEKIQSIGTGYLCYQIGKNNSLVFSSRADKIAAVDCSGNVRVWSTAGGKELAGNHYDIGIPSVVFTEDGKIQLLAPPTSITINPWTYRVFREGYYSRPSSFKFLDNLHVAIQYYGTECMLPLNPGTAQCAADEILGTDHNYYSYQMDNNKIRLFASPAGDNTASLVYETPSQKPFLDSGAWRVFGFDREHALLFDAMMLGQYYTQVNIIDLKTNQKVLAWEKYDIISYQFSEDNKVAALLLQPFWNYSEPSRLVLFSLEQKKIIFEEDFLWYRMPTLALSNSAEGRLLVFRNNAAEKPSQLVLVNLDQPKSRKIMDVDCSGSTLGKPFFSSDGAFIIAICSDDSLRFLNSKDGKEFYRINGYRSVENLAFSPDGKKMAVYFGEGVISVLAIPPFYASAFVPEPVSSPGINAYISFEYPKDGQTLGYKDIYMFKIFPVADAQQYSWSFSQNGKIILADRLTQDTAFSVFENDPAHSQFVLGKVQVSVRAKINGTWSKPNIITIVLK